MPGPLAICACVRPVELPGLRCGACGLRRLGDDLSPAQFAALVAVLGRGVIGVGWRH